MRTLSVAVVRRRCFDCGLAGFNLSTAYNFDLQKFSVIFKGLVTQGVIECKKFPGGVSERATPVPIPNTAVKPLSADGTAVFCRGRVGRRQVINGFEVIGCRLD